MRRSLVPFSLVLALATLVPAPRAFAVSKEMIQLQTQVQQLSDMLQHLQQSNDERMGVLQHLVEQTADNVNRMSTQMTALQGQVESANKNDQLAGQIQGLNDSVDEMKTRLGRIDKQLQDIQGALQNVQSQPASTQQPAQPMPGGTGQPLAPQPQASTPAAPPVDQLYQGGLRDYNSARYDVATSEFADVLKYYPGDALAGNAAFYLGEISYRQGYYPAAIKNYDMVLEQFAGSPKAAAAQLRKGQAELATAQRDAGIRDLRALIQRYPTSPESAQARSLLNGMGVRITPKPSPGR